MSKIKHNKKRNVGIIYELLVRHMSKALISEDASKVDKIKTLIEHHFHKKTELYQEYRIFTALLNNIKNINYTKSTAQSLLNESKNISKNINVKKLEKEKSALIKEINYSFNKAFYFEHIPSYKKLATIQVVMNEWKKKNNDIQNTVLLESKIINSLVDAMPVVSYEQLKESSNSSNTDKIVMNIMTKKINNKYKHMTNEQKDLIKSYAFYIENDKNKLINFLSEQKQASIALLESFKVNNDSDYLKQKINSVISNVTKINESNLCDETMVKFLTVSQLITELKSEE